jgi:hypothetical protein
MERRPSRRNDEGDGMKESAIQARILNVLRRLPDLVWVERNNSGKLPDRNGRPVTYGLGIGSADVALSVAPLGLSLWEEVKQPKKDQTEEQLAWAARQRAIAWARPEGNVFKTRTVEEACKYVLDTYRFGLELLCAAGRMSATEVHEACVKAQTDVERAKAEASDVETARTERRNRRPKRKRVPASAARATTF